jgi:hypothetical protein
MTTNTLFDLSNELDGYSRQDVRQIDRLASLGLIDECEAMRSIVEDIPEMIAEATESSGWACKSSIGEFIRGDVSENINSWGKDQLETGVLATVIALNEWLAAMSDDDPAEVLADLYAILTKAEDNPNEVVRSLEMSVSADYRSGHEYDDFGKFDMVFVARQIEDLEIQ